MQYNSRSWLKTAALNWYLHGLIIEESNFRFWMISWLAENTIFYYLKRKSSNLVKSHELIRHFIVLYLVPLPPYFSVYFLFRLSWFPFYPKWIVPLTWLDSFCTHYAPSFYIKKWGKIGTYCTAPVLCIDKVFWHR